MHTGLYCLRVVMPPAIEVKPGKVKAVQGDHRKLKWVPDQGLEVTEALGLWVQPGSLRARMLTTLMLSGDVDHAVAAEVEKLRPEIETSPWSALYIKVAPEVEQEVVQELAPRAGGKLTGIKSKYTLLDAVVEVTMRVSSKTLLTTWSSNVITKDQDARAMWNILWPKLFQHEDIRSEPGDDQPQTDAQAASGSGEKNQGGGKHSEKAMVLLSSLQDLNIPEEDKLQAMIAEDYVEEIDVEVLLMPATGIFSGVKRRLPQASEEEAKWWWTMIVKFVKHVRKARLEDEEAARAERRAAADAARKPPKETIDQAPRKTPEKNKSMGSPSPRSRKYAKDNLGNARRVLVPDDGETSESHGQHREGVAGLRDEVEASKPRDTGDEAEVGGKWHTGAGVNKVTVERLTKGPKRLRPVLLTGFQYTDPMDSYAAREGIFGAVSLDYRTFRDMLRQYNEVVMFVPGDKLDAALSGVYRDSFRVSAARDPMQRSDEIEIKELLLLDGLKKIVARIPAQPSGKANATTAVPVTGVYHQESWGAAVWCIMPPYSADSAFMSLWGYGGSVEIEAAVEFHSDTPAVDSARRTTVERHAIWGLQSAFSSTDRCSSTSHKGGSEDDAQEWEQVADDMELRIRHRGHGLQEAPEWALQEIAQSATIKRASRRVPVQKTGNYQPTSAQGCQADELGLYTLAGEFRMPESSQTEDDVRELTCRGRVTKAESVRVTKILGPKWTGQGTRLETMGTRSVQLIGKAPTPEGDAVQSGVLACGTTKFVMQAASPTIGKCGILQAPAEDSQEGELITRLWVVMQVWEHGRDHQVLLRAGRAHRTRRRTPSDMIQWWKAICRATGWDATQRQWAGETVKNKVWGGKSTVYLDWTAPEWNRQKYEAKAWSAMRVPEACHQVSMGYSLVSVNCQGINREKEQPRKKWDEVVVIAQETRATVVTCQETWGSDKKRVERQMEGFWHENSKHTKVGQANEVWVRHQWATKQAVILDTPSALLILTHNAAGVGVVGSVHMAQKNEPKEYTHQLVEIRQALDVTPHNWMVVGGDWNRDIRPLIKATTETIATLQRQDSVVAFMSGRQQHPKDFFMLRGMHMQELGVWLTPVGDHPVVWVKDSVQLTAGATPSALRPVTPLRWDGSQKKMFSDIMEAYSASPLVSTEEWLHTMREVIVLANQEFMKSASEPESDDREIIRRLKTVVQGKGWKVRDVIQQSLTAKFWEATIENWKQVARRGLQGRTLKVLRLQAANPFLKMHKVADTESGEVVEGSDILRVVSRECAKKYPRHSTTVPSEWVAGLVERQVAKASSSRVEQVADTIESKDAGRVSVATMLNRKAEFSNKTAGVDCVVPSLLKLFGMRTASKFADILNMEYGQWPEETRQVLHMTLHKSTGFDVNKNTRPIKVLSALLRIQAKLLAPMVQTLTRPRWSAGRQFAGYKGSSVHGMRRLMHILITQALATKGAVGVMLLDIVGAYDEVMR